jgi:hypothetical protein
MIDRRHCLALLPFVLAFAAAACSKEKPAAKASAAAARAPDPWFAQADQNCQFDSTNIHPDPDGLVREFVTRDAEGTFFVNDPWFASAVECPGRETAGTEYTIVTNAEVVPLRTIGDSARVGVKYTLLGVADANGFRPDLRTVTDTIRVNRSRFGWRIQTPAPVPHVTLDVAKRKQTFTRADLWALDAALTQTKRLSPPR